MSRTVTGRAGPRHEAQGETTLVTALLAIATLIVGLAMLGLAAGFAGNAIRRTRAAESADEEPLTPYAAPRPVLESPRGMWAGAGISALLGTSALVAAAFVLLAVSAAPTRVLDTPARAGGLQRDDSPGTRQLTTRQRERLRAAGMPTPLTAVYHRPATRNMTVLFIGASGHLDDPPGRLREFISGLAVSAGGGGRAPAPYPAGRLEGTRAAQERLVVDRLKGVVGELQVDPVELEQPVILLHLRVARLGEDADQRLAVEVVHTRDHGKASDELRDHPELQEVFRHDVGEQVGHVAVVVLGAQDRVEADALLADTLLDDLLQTGERAAADEQHVGRVDLDELLVRVLAAALRRHARRGALQDLQQRLLNAFAGDVARDRGVLALAGDLVDLVDVDAAGLGLLDVVVGGLDQLQQDVLDVLADVAGLGEGGRVGDGERNVEQFGERLREERLAGSGRAQQQDVGLGGLDALVPAAAARLDPHVVVVYRHGQGLFRLVLPDHVRVEELVDLAGFRQVVPLEVG